MSRLEIKESTIKLLFGKNNGFCAYPGCEIPTVEATETTERVNVEMAHICAANEGGPRFDDSQSDEDRRSFANLLLMCPSHHRNNLDKGWPNEYTRQRVREMKSVSESSPSGFEIGDDQIAGLRDVYVAYEQTIREQFVGNGAIVNAQDSRVAITQGFTPSEVNMLLENQHSRSLEAFSQGARVKAKERVEDFDRKATSAIYRRNVASAAEDPAFVISARKAQEAAACSGTEEQIDVLVSLLAERGESESSQRAKIAIDQAYDVIAQASPESLNLLTVSHLAAILVHTGSEVENVVSSLGGIIRKFSLDFPEASLWIEELEMLNAFAVSPIGSRKSLQGIWESGMPGLVTGHVPEDSQFSHDMNPKTLENYGVLVRDDPRGLLLAFSARQEIVKRFSAASSLDQKSVEVVVNQLLAKGRDSEKVRQLTVRIEKDSFLNALAQWHDSLPAFRMSTIGKVAVFVNIKRKISPTVIGVANLEEFLGQ